MKSECNSKFPLLHMLFKFNGSRLDTSVYWIATHTGRISFLSLTILFSQDWYCQANLSGLQLFTSNETVWVKMLTVVFFGAVVIQPLNLKPQPLAYYSVTKNSKTHCNQCHQPETQQQHTDSNKTGTTPTLLVLGVQDAPWEWFVKNRNMSELAMHLRDF